MKKYEEIIDNGQLFFRTNENSQWRIVSNSDLLAKITELKNSIKTIKEGFMSDPGK